MRTILHAQVPSSHTLSIHYTLDPPGAKTEIPVGLQYGTHHSHLHSQPAAQRISVAVAPSSTHTLSLSLTVLQFR